MRERGLGSLEQAFPGGPVVVDPGAVAAERLLAAPVVAASDARVQATARLARVGAVVPVLVAYGMAPDDAATGCGTRGGGIGLDLGDLGAQASGELRVRQLGQLGRTVKGQARGFGHVAVGTEEGLWARGQQRPAIQDGGQGVDAGPVMDLLDDEVLHGVAEGVDHLGEHVMDRLD